jgi:hypothetical protein
MHTCRQLWASVWNQLSSSNSSVGSPCTAHLALLRGALSVYDRLHDDLQGSLQLDSQQKLVYLVVNDGMATGQLDIT